MKRRRSAPSRIRASDAGVVDEATLAALSFALGAAAVPRVTEAETALPRSARDVPGDLVAATREAIEEGADPLGEAFRRLRSAARRRRDGAVHTPRIIVRSMLSWAENAGAPGPATIYPDRLAQIDARRGPGHVFAQRHGKPRRRQRP